MKYPTNEARKQRIKESAHLVEELSLQEEDEDSTENTLISSCDEQ